MEADALSGMRLRVRSRITMHMNDASVLGAALYASCNSATELFELSYSGHSLRELKAASGSFAISMEEWEAVFSRSSCRIIRSDRVAALVKRPQFLRECNMIEAALSCTLAEEEQRRAWTSPMTKVAAFVALHSSTDTEGKLSSILGAIVRADARRLEDLRATAEETGPDVVLLASAVDGLVHAVVP